MVSVIGWRNDQLGGRLTGLLYAWQLAKFLDADLGWVWPAGSKDTHSKYNLPHVFDEAVIAALSKTDGVRLFSENAEITAALGSGAGPDAALPGAEALDRRERGEALDEIIWWNDTGSALHRRDLGGREAAETQRMFAELTLNPTIQKAIDDIDRRFDLSNTVALHLRRGDVVERVFFSHSRKSIDFSDSSPIRGFVARFLPLATAKRLLEAEIADQQRIVLFSDGLEDRQHMERHYGDRVVDVHAALDQYPMLPVQRAMCELVLMGRTRRTYGCASHFSGCASIIGGTEVVKLNHALTADELIGEIRDFLARSSHAQDTRDMILANLLSAYRRYFEKRKAKGVSEVLAIDDELRRIGHSVREARPVSVLVNQY